MTHSRLFLAILLAALLTGSLHGDEKPKMVAGRPLEGWINAMKSTNELVRVRGVKTLGEFGEKATDALITALEDESAAVRYVAASNLGRIGKSATKAIAQLKKLKVDKDNPGVAMAAAFALCRIDKPKGNIDLLISRLTYPERGMACAAAEFLGGIGPEAKAAIPALETAFQKDRDYHVRGAAQNALRKIQPGWKPGTK